MPSPFDTSKNDLLAGVLDHLGVRLPGRRHGWISVSCPGEAHTKGDRRPSASVNLSLGKFHCHGCGLHGDGFDLMYEIEGMMAPQVMALLGLQAAKQESDWLL